MILTARAVEEPVHQFLDDIGLPRIPVIALADSDPKKKADYIERRIRRDGFDYVEFFDDSYKNIQAVSDLAPRFPDVRISTRHIVEKTKIN